MSLSVLTIYSCQDYVMTMPYAHCKGILMGTMTMELGGKVRFFLDDRKFYIIIRIFIENLAHFFRK